MICKIGAILKEKGVKDFPLNQLFSVQARPFSNNTFNSLARVFPQPTA